MGKYLVVAAISGLVVWSFCTYPKESKSAVKSLLDGAQTAAASAGDKLAK